METYIVYFDESGDDGITTVSRVFATFEAGDILNLKASLNKYGLVIYPKA